MKSILTTLLVVLAVVAGIWYFRGDKDDSQEGQKQNSSQPSNSSNNSSGSGNSSTNTPDDSESSDSNNGSVVEEIPNSLRGELNASNDKNRGNLMLLLADSDRIIYLNTSRDYSALIGKNVVVMIDGSMDDFLLVDIKEQGN